MLRKRLRRKLRTFEETQISNIIRRAKGKRTLLLKFHQFYSAKNPEGIPINLENNNSPSGNNRKPIFLNRKPLKKQKIEEKKFRNFLKKFFDEGLRQVAKCRKP